MLLLKILESVVYFLKVIMLLVVVLSDIYDVFNVNLGYWF